MKALVTATGRFGPFSNIETLSDRYRCDGVDYQFDVIGPATIDVNAPAPDEPALTRAQLKIKRAEAVANIKVTTAAGNTFDGDEESQGRMTRAIIALSTGLAPSVNWVLADNSVIAATAAELTEALVLAGQAQAAIWIIE